MNVLICFQYCWYAQYVKVKKCKNRKWINIYNTFKKYISTFSIGKYLNTKIHVSEDYEVHDNQVEIHTLVYVVASNEL